MINLYDSKETSFNHNGLVVLSDCKAAYVEELLNDNYEIELEYPIDVRGKWQYLVEENIIKADGQLFRIYHKEKTLAGIKANARHIFYDLAQNLCEDCRLTNEDGARALEWMLEDNTQYPHNFTNASDLDVAIEHTRYYTRRNPVDIIMNSTDGIIATWGGELIRDNFSIRLMQNRGLDRGVLVSYGKNILGIEETLDVDNICTRLMPIGSNDLLLPEVYIDSPYINSFSHPKIKIQPFSDIEVAAAINIFYKDRITNGHWVNYQTGLLVASTDWFASEPIGVFPSTEYEKTNDKQFAFYDSALSYISGVPDGTSTFTTPSNAAYVRITGLVTALDSLQLCLSKATLRNAALDQLRAAGQKYIIDSKCDVPQLNYKVDFLELSKTEEYKHYSILETVYLGDTITIKNTKLNIDIKAKIIRTKKNLLTNRIEEVELGSFKSNLASSLNSAVSGNALDDYLKAGIIKIGVANEYGTSQIDTRGDGMRFQAHVPGNYTKLEDNGGLSFYVGDVCYAQIYPDGTTNLHSSGEGGGSNSGSRIALLHGVLKIIRSEVRLITLTVVP